MPGSSDSAGRERDRVTPSPAASARFTANLLVAADPAGAALAGAEEFARIAIDSARFGRFTVALSGGSTPRAMFTLLAKEPFAERIPWQAAEIFWGDERMVPPDHPDSNYRMAREALLSHVPVDPAHVHRMGGELDPNHAADEYQATLAAAFGPGLPRFDLILLGMGDDGHTASLFPGTRSLDETERTVVPNFVPRLNMNRLTLSAPAINSAANVIFLVAGGSKSQILHEVVEGPRRPRELPSQMIKPVNGNLTWILDSAAASRLDSARPHLAAVVGRDAWPLRIPINF